MFLRCSVALLLAWCAGCGDAAGPSPPPPDAAAQRQQASLRQAVEHYAAQVRRDPRSSAAHEGLAAALAALGDTAGARVQRETALQLDPGRWRTRLLLAQQLAQAGDTAAARSHVAQVLALQPQQHEALLLRLTLATAPDDTGALTACARLLPSARTDTAVRRAVTSFLAGHTAFLTAHGAADAAAGRLQQALRQLPDDPALLLALASAERATGRMLQARHLLDGLQQRLPDDRAIAAARADVETLFSPVSALALWRALAERGELSDTEKTGYAAALLSDGKTAEALALLQAADGVDGEVAVRRAGLLALAGNVPRARSVLETALAAAPTLPAARLAADLAARAGDAAAAIRHLQSVRRLAPADSAAALALAQRLQTGGDGDGALAVLGDALRAGCSDPAVVEAALTTAAAWLRRAPAPELPARWQRAVALLGESPRLLLAGADAFLPAGDDRTAAALLQRLPAATPGRALRLAHLYRQQNDETALAQVLPAALAEQPTDAWLRYQQGVLQVRQQAWDAAAAAFTAAASGRGAVRGAALLWQAELARAGGNLPLALQRYAQAFVAGADPRYLVRRAQVAARAGNRILAEQSYRQRLAQAGDDWRALFGLAGLLTERRQYAAARPYWRALAAVRPETALPHYWRGVAAWSDGRITDARAAFAAALQRKPDFIEAAYAGALCDARLQPGAPPAAWAAAVRAVRPATAAAACLLAALQRSAGDTAAALTALEPFLAPGRATAEVLRLRALLHAGAGEGDAALALLAAARTQFPADARLRRAEAELLTQLAARAWQQGDTPATRRYAARAAAADAALAAPCLLLADALAAAGAWTEALAALQDYRARGGDRPVRIRRAQALAGSGEQAAALAEYRAALSAGERDTVAYAALARAAAASGDARNALLYCGQWLAAEPNSSIARLLAAAQRERSGDFGGALADYQRVLAAEPGNAAAAQGLAELCRRRNDPAGALRAYAALLRAVPDNAAAWHNLGLLYGTLGDPAAAAAALTRAAALQPRPETLQALATACLAAADYPGALQAAAQLRGTVAAAAGEALTQRAYAAQGDACLRVNDGDGAQRAYDALIAHAPAHWAGYERRGRLQLRRGEAAAAVRDLREAVRLAPAAQQPRALLGEAYAAQGMQAAALAELRQAVVQNAADAAAQARLGLLLAEAGDPAAATPVRAALAADGSSAVAHRAAGIMALTARDYAAARRSLERAVQLDPYAVAGYTRLAEACAASGDLPAALQALARAQALRPRDADLWRREGALRARSGERAAAVTAYRRALALQADGATWFVLAETLRESGAPAAAADAYRAALADASFRQRGRAHNGLGLVAAAGGDAATAVAQFTAALAADRGDAEAALNLAALYRSGGNAAAAVQAARQALARDSRSARGHYELALALVAAGDRPAAVQALRRARDLAPANDDYRALARRLGDDG